MICLAHDRVSRCGLPVGGNLIQRVFQAGGGKNRNLSCRNRQAESN
jgi:hypothetical protein